MNSEEAADTRAAVDRTAALRVICWGTRGSVPAAGPATVRFGGNTPCVELRLPDGRCCIFDAGTGIVPLGRRLVRASAARSTDLFLTHFHWDHIQGLPFFAPLDDATWRVCVHAQAPAGMDVQTLLAAQMRVPYFPIELQQVRARIEYQPIAAAPQVDDDIEVTSFRVRHAGLTYGFRVRCAGVTVVYVPDNEVRGSGYDVPASWEHDFIEFIAEADVLIHDAMYTTAEYEERRGWGHSTFEQAVQLAETAAARRLLLFHHAPERDDAALAAVSDRLRRDSAARGSQLIIEAAAERSELALPIRRPRVDA